jgi:hypothetical protein
VPPYSYYEGGTCSPHYDVPPQLSGSRGSDSSHSYLPMYSTQGGHGYNKYNNSDGYDDYRGYNGYEHPPASTDLPLRKKDSPVSSREESQTRKRVNREGHWKTNWDVCFVMWLMLLAHAQPSSKDLRLLRQRYTQSPNLVQPGS